MLIVPNDAAARKSNRVLLVSTVPITLYHLRGFVEWLAKHGYEVHVASAPRELETFVAGWPCVVHRLPLRRRMSPFADLWAIACLTRLIWKIDPAVIHTHSPKASLLSMLAASITARRLKIYHVHGAPFETATGLSRLVLIVSERLTAYLADEVWCVSNSVLRLLTEIGVPQTKMRVPQNGSIAGVEARRSFSPDARAADRMASREKLGLGVEDILVGFVGRLSGDKGIDELRHAWASLSLANSHAYLVVVGDIDERQPISGDLESWLASGPHVFHIPHTMEPAAWFAAMDVFVLPSYREGFPVVVLEAAAMALPTVATRVTGCVDGVIDGCTGALVPVRDANALEGAIGQYLKSAALRQSHGIQARARVLADFEPTALYNDYLTHYRRTQTE